MNVENKGKWISTLAATALLGASPAALAANHALLVGVGDYLHLKDLEGPRHDVSALESVLPEWGVPRDNIRILIDKAATREQILSELDALYQRTQAGDQIFFYFSGHGTSWQDVDSKGLGLPLQSGALAVYDSKLDGSASVAIQSLIVGRDDLRPRLKKLDQNGRHSFVVFDACFSGRTVRSIFGNGSRKPKSVPVTVEIEDLDSSVSSTGPDPYPYKNLLYIAASGASEEALDLSSPQKHETFDGRPHGAFSNELLKLLHNPEEIDSNHNGEMNYQELFGALKQAMQAANYRHAPVMLPEKPYLIRQQLASQPLFGTPRAINVQHNTAASNTSIIQQGPLTVQIDIRDAGLKTQLQRSPYIQLVEQGANIRLQQQGAALSLYRGEQIVYQYDSYTPARVMKRLENEYLFRRHLMGTGSNQQFNTTLSLIGPGVSSTVCIGDTLGIKSESERQVWLMLINFAADGSLSLLYPLSDHEVSPIPAGTIKELMNEIDVVPPTGIDHLIALAFDKRVEELNSWLNREITMDQLLVMLQRHRGHWARDVQTITTIAKQGDSL